MAIAIWSNPWYPEYTEEQLNYFRICYVFTDILAEGLRSIFKQEWDSRYKTTKGEWKDEPQNGLNFYNGESLKNQQKQAHHLDVMMNGNTSEWDCTMLFYAILYSDCIINLNPRVKAIVDELRKSRNRYLLGMPRSHLYSFDFELAISEVSNAFEALGLPTYQIQGVLDRTVEYTEEQLNYFRICFIVTDLVTEGLRSIFKQEWDYRYKATLGKWKDDDRNKMDFYNKEKGKRGSLDFVNKKSVAEWDCGMLINAILKSDSIYRPNFAIRSPVDDLRKLQSRYVQRMPRGHLSDSEFRIVTHEVIVAFQSLGLPISKVVDIRSKFDSINLKGGPENSNVAVIKLGNLRSIPPYILARGPEAKEAYQRALETGKTSDKRVKVFLVGQDRVGKTSVGRSLKGEQFRKDESSTNGVQMDLPLKHVGILPWRNSTEELEMTSFHYKCAQYLSDHLSTVSSEEKACGKKNMTEKITGGTELPLRLDDRVEESNELQGPHWDRKTATENVATPVSQDTAEPAKYRNPDEIHLKKRQETRRKDDIPETVTRLAIENLSWKKPVNDDRIWPVILDFAGQAIYRAIHPLFTSREAIYLLMFDLTKDLSAAAHCFVKEPQCSEVEIQAPDSNDTNLDHIMRWMDLVHSYKHVVNGEILPPVILVGTHADLLEGDLSVKTNCVEDVKEKICDTTRDFSEHIGKTFAVNNTLAGIRRLDKEDPQVVSLREEILKVGDAMPHTKTEVPLKWLQVEDEVFDLASKGTNYITRQNFKENICDETCQFEKEGDFEVLLNFLHDRGTVVYHGCATDPGSLVVLNPKWLVEVLCQIVTVEKQNEENTRIRNLRKDLGQKGILHEELLDYSCEKLNLTDIKGSLLTLMKKFNLLCEYTCKEGSSIYLVPCMLISKAEDKLMLNTSGNQELAPAYITFNTQYVPGGLFSRLVVLFVEFAERRIACDQPKLCANFARFFIGEFTGIEFICYKRVIKIRVWDHDNANSNPIEKEPDACSEVLRFLMISLTRLHEECHWLHAVSWDLCARCNLCRPESGDCDWHGKQGCLHDDCAHYVSLTKKPVRCAHTDGPVYRPNKTWIQTLEDVTGHKQPFLQTMCTKLAQMEVAPTKGQSFTAVSEKRASHEDTRSTAHVKEARTVAPEKERFCTVGFKRDALDLGMLSVAPAKVARIDSACQEPDEDTQSTIAPEKVAPPGTRLKEHTVINDDLERLSRSIGNNWMSLGRRLNIDQAMLDSIQVDASRPNLAEKAFQMLLRWREEKGSDATYWVLCVALCHEFVSRRDLAEKICFRKVL